MRSDITDARAQPVENLATNPSFERVSTGTTVVRRNLAQHPRADTTWIGNNGTGGATTLSFENSMRKVTWTAQASGGSPQLIAGYSVTVNTGQTYTVSLLSAASNSVRLVLDWLLNGTWVTSSVYSVPSISSDTAAPTRISITATVPSGVNQLQPLVRWQVASSTAPGNWIAGDQVLIELRPAPALPYFDGSTTDNTGIAYSWDGTAGSSSSSAKSSVTEVRRNLAIDPQATGFGSGSRIQNDRYTADGTYDTATGITNGPQGITTVARYTVTTARLGHGFNIAGNVEAGSAQIANSFAATPGVTYTTSVWVYQTAALNIAIRARPADSTGQWIASQTTGTIVDGVAGGWVRVSVSITAPANTAYIAYTVSATSGSIDSAGSVWMATGLLSEVSDSLGTYFDGSITPDSDLTPIWVGATNNSQNVLSGISVSGVTSGSSATSFLSWQWASQGGSSVRIVPKTTSSDTYMSLNGDTGGMRMGLQAGGTYTVLARVRLTTSQTGTLVGTARRIRQIYKRSGGSSYIEQSSPQAPNTPGETALRFTFSIPADTTEAFVRLMNGASGGNGEVWWDQVALMKGVYTGPYIDGNMPGCIWRGTPHASTSVGYPSSV